MKKIICLIIFVLALVGCTNNEKSEIKILVPNGTPFIAVGDLVDQIEIESVAGPDLLIAGMISKSHDIIIAPLNVGTKVYLNNSSIYKLASIITLGNTYVVSRKTTPLDTLTDLLGKEIMAYGRNATPDLILRKSLNDYEVEAEITYKNGIDEIIPFFVCNPNDPTDTSCNPPQYIVCAEPFITKLELEYNMELNVLDLQEFAGDFPQAAIFINPESDSNQVMRVLDQIKSNIEFLNNNPQEYTKSIIKKHQYFKNLGDTILEKSIPRSNIDYLDARENINLINDFFEMLNEYNPNLLGGQIPDQEFYN